MSFLVSQSSCLAALLLLSSYFTLLLACCVSFTVLLVGLQTLIVEISTVNSEIFARVYFRETSQMRSFVIMKSSINGEITLSFTGKGKSCPSREFLTLQYSFNAVCENKTLAKISGFTVTMLTSFSIKG